MRGVHRVMEARRCLSALAILRLIRPLASKSGFVLEHSAVEELTRLIMDTVSSPPPSSNLPMGQLGRRSRAIHKLVSLRLLVRLCPTLIDTCRDPTASVHRDCGWIRQKQWARGRRCELYFYSACQPA